MEPSCQLGLCSQRLFEGYLFQLFECVRRVQGITTSRGTRVQIGSGVESKPRAVDKLHDTIIESLQRMGGGVRCDSTAAVGPFPLPPRCSARVSRCLTEEGCHRVPPRGVCSAWPQAGQRSGRWSAWRRRCRRPANQSTRQAGAAPGPTISPRRFPRRPRRTVRRSSTVQGVKRTSPPGLGGRIRRTVATTCPTGPGRRPDVPHRGWRDLADGVRPGADGIAADTTAARAARAPLVRSAISACLVSNGAQHLQRYTPRRGRRSGRAGCGSARLWPRAVR